MNAAAMACRAVANREAERRYLDALNVCFPAWGGREMFDWCFAREGAGLRPDLMTLDCGGHPVAGTANTYRRIRLPNGRTLVAAIMTGSWTLPESRGLGAFTRLIGESRERAAERGAGLLLAFVTQTNASANRLREAGAALFPTWYGRSPEERLADRGDVEWHDSDRLDEIEDADAGEIDEGEGERGARFVYTGSEWRDQFLLRPAGITWVRGAAPAPASAATSAPEDAVSQPDRTNAWSALVERTPQFDRVMSMSAGDRVWDDAIGVLEARAAAANRRLFCFTSRPRQASRLRARGFEIVDGYITALIASETALRSALAPGASAPDPDASPSRATSSAHALSSYALADAGSPWYLGGWSVRNGDRM